MAIYRLRAEKNCNCCSNYQQALLYVPIPRAGVEPGVHDYWCPQRHFFRSRIFGHT